MCTRAQLDIIEKEMVEAFQKYYGDRLVKVYLYGSYARGDNTEYSDVDIAGIVKGDRLELQKILHLIIDVACEIGLDNETVIAPTVIPYDEFTEMREVLPYYHNIYTEGVELSA